jgi:hypothetical protein
MARKRAAAKTSTIHRAVAVVSPAGALHLVRSEPSSKTIQKHVDNLWALGGEIVRDLNENPSLRRKTSSRFSMTGSMRRVGRSSMPLNRKSRYNDPSTPPAGGFSVSSANSGTEPLKSPKNSPDEAFS